MISRGNRKTSENDKGRNKALSWILPVVLSAYQLTLSFPSCAGDFSSSAIGTVSSAELTLGVGARGIAMGEAFSAVADDVSALHWNPAGLAAIPTGSASFMHSNYIGGITYDFLAYGHRVAEGQVLAGSLQTFDYGSIERRDVDNIADGNFHPRSTLYSFGYAQNVHEIEEGGNISAGFSYKMLESKIAQTARAHMIDVGFQVRIPGDIPSQTALVVQNLGIGPKFDKQREQLPTQVKGGLAFYPRRWVLALDLIAPRGNSPYAAAGVEYKQGWAQKLSGSLRAGYNTLTIANGPSGLKGFSGGMGIEVAGFSVDYAIVPFGDLGVTHRLSLTYALPSFEED